MSKNNDTPITATPIAAVEVPETVDTLLATILCWPRGDGSPSEIKFRSWLDNEIQKAAGRLPVQLARGCRYITIPRPDGKIATTLFSCHIDTCDNAGGYLVPSEADPAVHVPLKKSVVYDNNFGLISLAADNKVGTCLGADDGIGVWMMLNMLQRKVPGGYIFHTGEEIGGQGSNAVLKENGAVLKLYDIALAFDRPRTDEVITHQGGMECASDKCASMLRDRLNKHGFFYKLSQNGTFTDTKVYRKVIPECFNLGVGYQWQHGAKEEQDYPHALALLEAVCKIDFESLPVERDPTKADVYNPKGWATGTRGFNTQSYGRASRQEDLEFDDAHLGSWPQVPTKKAPPAPVAQPKPAAVDGPKMRAPQYEPLASVYDDLVLTKYDDLVSYIEDSPESVAVDIVMLLAEIGRLRSDVNVLNNVLLRESL